VQPNQVPLNRLRLNHLRLSPQEPSQVQLSQLRLNHLARRLPLLTLVSHPILENCLDLTKEAN
jgi:hypothetical protein